VTGLPVNIISFLGRNSNGTENILEWQTASETNNNYFSIERSFYGKIFSSIGQVEGAGNSNQSLSYQFQDNLSLTTSNQQPATIYYRLKQVDFDGQYTYSNTISVQINAAGRHPVIHQTGDYLVISMDHKAGQEITIYIYDILGREVYHKRFKGLQEHKILLNRFKRGNYYIHVQAEGIDYRQKLVIH